MNSQNMTLKSLRISILATLALVLSFGFSVANGPTSASEDAQRLRTQIQQLVKTSDLDANLNGEAVVTFHVDADNRIEVLKVSSSNHALSDHIESSLNGQRVDGLSMDKNQKIRVDLTFNDKRKTMRF